MRLLLYTFILIFISCVSGSPGGGGGESSDNNGDANVTSSDNNTSNFSIEGDWVLDDCSNDIYRAWEFTSNTAKYTYREYGNSNCSTVFDERVEYYSYTTTETQLTLTLTKFEVTAFNYDAWVTSMNNDSECGHNDWVKDTTKDVTNKTCFGKTYTYGDENTYTINKDGSSLTIYTHAGSGSKDYTKTGSLNIPASVDFEHYQNFNITPH